MTIIGLTGRAGSGKSEAESVIKAFFSAWILDLDKVGHEALKNPDIKTKLTQNFGDSIIIEHEIDRKKLGGIVFSDREKLNRLNAIVHPYMKECVIDFIKHHPNQDGVISGALLEEIGLLSICDVVITLESSDKTLQNISEKQWAIRKNQKSEAHYRSIANIVIYNDYTKSFYEEIKTALRNSFGT